MKSFVFWLTAAMALGAILRTLIPASPLEILVVWFAVNALYYGIRNWQRSSVPSAAH